MCDSAMYAVNRNVRAICAIRGFASKLNDSFGRELAADAQHPAAAFAADQALPQDLGRIIPVFPTGNLFIMNRPSRHELFFVQDGRAVFSRVPAVFNTRLTWCLFQPFSEYAESGRHSSLGNSLIYPSPYSRKISFSRLGAQGAQCPSIL